MILFIINFCFINFVMFIYLLLNLFTIKKNKVIILRGLPGSGKSTFIRNYIEDMSLIPKHYGISCFKHHFNGIPGNLPMSYSKSFYDFIDYVNNKKEYIFVDNPNIQKWEMENYIYFARLSGYDIEIYHIDCPDRRYLEYFRNRSSYDVSKNTMLSMYNRWDEFDIPNITETLLVPYIEVDLSSNGDSLPFPKKTKDELDIELEEIIKKKYI